MSTQNLEKGARPAWEGRNWKGRKLGLGEEGAREEARPGRGGGLERKLGLGEEGG